MLTAFTAGLLLITISELGDKTFFIGVVLAMRYPRRWVFIGVTLALILMTILSVVLGTTVALLPKIYTHVAAIALFFLFGLKLLYDAGREWLKQRQLKSEETEQGLNCVTLAEPGCPDSAQEAVQLVDQAAMNLKGKGNWAICLEAFIMTFLAEWGDRTQFATIMLAASNPVVGVTLGAIVGHTFCAAIAVMGGKLIAGKLSEQVINAIGGTLFLIFGTVTWLQGV